MLCSVEVASYSSLYILYFIGEPTIEEKAEIFIEALNLGLPSYPEEFNNFTDYEPQFEKRSFRGGGTSLKMQDGNSVSVRELNRCSPNSKICPFTNST